MPNPQFSAVSASASASKRKAEREDDGDVSDSDSDVSMVNVDFDFYNLNEDVDQIAIKRLLRQTLSHDDHLVDVHPLADLILAEGKRMAAGTTIKTDGEESDPWGVLAAVDLRRCQSNPALKPLLEYFLSTAPPESIKAIFDDKNSAKPALLFSLRMLNLPIPLIPPLYKMLGSELASADFTHYVLWGRGYRLEGSEGLTGLEMDAGNKTSAKKKKTAAEALAAGAFAYHPEEEMIDARAVAVHSYPLKTAPPRDDEAFGVEQFGRLVLIETGKLAEAVGAMEEACKP